VNRKVTAPVLVLAAVLVAALLYGIYHFAQPSPILHPGAEDIPPIPPGGVVPVKPPPDAGPVPGTINR
jgi:hypothetical protein